MITAGGLELKNRLCLAPMAGVTTITVREFFSSLGAALTHTEMISCAGLIRDNAKTYDMMKVSEHESPLVIQLFANDDKVLVEGAECVLKSGNKFSAFGINMACPMPKITRNGSGSALLKDSAKASRMVAGLKRLGLPVWVKIRKLENDSESLRFIDALVNAGADNICIHGRTPAQRYEGVADRSIIAESSKRFAGYISASGDVKTVDDINEYLSYGCVMVMIARGAVANPFIFEEFSGIFRNIEAKLEALLNFSDNTLRLSGEHKAVVLLKRFAGSMLRFSEGSADLRRRAMMSINLEELIEVLREGVKKDNESRIYTRGNMFKEDNV